MAELKEDLNSIEYVEFENCTNGLGIKLIGGFKDTENFNLFYGVYIRKLLPRGLASLEGGLKVSDQIRMINGDDIQGLDKLSTIRKLQHAASTGHVTLGIVNNEPSRREFKKILTLYEFDRIISKSNECVNMIPSNETADGVTLLENKKEFISKVPTNGNQLDIPQSLIYDSNKMLSIQQLEMALHYLGINASESELQKLRDTLCIDLNGMVLYEDFVETAKIMFKKELDECKVDTLVIKDEKPSKDPTKELIEENKRLKAKLEEKNGLIRELEDKLSYEQMTSACRQDEITNLKCRLNTSEHARTRALEVESDYETVIGSLQKKLTLSRRQNSRPNLQISNVDDDELRKKIAVLSCELRKSQRLQNTCQVASDKLFAFVENVRIKICAELKKSIPLSDDDYDHQMNSESYYRLTQLIQECTNILITVRELYNDDALPFGWEEAYTSDGTKHYINHVTQITTWQHPVSKMTFKSRLQE